MSKGSQWPTYVAPALCALLLVCSGVSSSQSPSDSDREVTKLLAQGYELLQRDTAKAIHCFERAAALEPSNVQIRKQLGSAYISMHRLEDAVVQFSLADVLAPSDSSKLQVAYLLNSLGRNRESYSIFRGLRTSNDKRIRDAARSATVVVDEMRETKRFPWWGRFNITSYYDSRFENGILSGAIRAGHYLDRGKIMSLTALVGITQDTRSTGGAVPVVLSDNYVLVAAGLRLQPVTGLTADVLGGAAFELHNRSIGERIRSDFRTILTYGLGYYVLLETPDGIQLSFKPWADAYFSAGYYSRYANFIGYNQARTGVRVIEAGYSAVDLYLRGDFAWDSDREFYNNIAEGSVGIRLLPHYSLGLSLMVEYHRGLYWDQGRPTGGYERWYDSVRIFAVLERSLTF